MPRSEQFYTEFIILTVLSILAANLWTEFFVQFLKNKNNSLIAHLFLAVITTGAALWLMWTFFTHSDKKGVDDEPTYNEELKKAYEKNENK